MIAVHVSRRSFIDRGIQTKSDSLLEFFLEVISGPAMPQKQKLEPRPLAMLAQLARLAKKLSDAFDNRLDLVPANETIQTGREMRFGRESASYAQRETSLGFSVQGARDRSQPNIVDLWIGAPNAATGDRNLEFARQIVEVGIARKHLDRGKRERRRIADFVGIHARHRAASDVPRDIAASSHAVQAALPQRLENLGKRFNGHPVKLDILTHGQVSNAASVTLGQISNNSQLR